MKKFKIVHDIPGRIRVRYGNYAFTIEQSLLIEKSFLSHSIIKKCETNDITGSVLLEYESDYRNEILLLLEALNLKELDVSKERSYIDSHQYQLVRKETNREYTEKIIKIVIKRYSYKLLLPGIVNKLLAVYHATKFIKEGWHSIKKGKIDVPVLDATSIIVSMINNDYNTAGNIMMLLNVSDQLEAYTKKTSTLQLEESLSVKFDKVWIQQEGLEIQIPMNELQVGDHVIVRTGAMIPVDGEIISGEGMINEASFTGEPLSKHVSSNDTVLAGTVVEEGSLIIKVRTLAKESRIAKIVDMINTNESLKAELQAHAEHLADSIVPLSFIGFFGMWAYTRSLVRASSVLLVDYSCAIKLATSISIISAMQEASQYSILVKGGKYLEGMAQADTIVFDKTGTLTHAQPTVMKVTPLLDYTREEVLKISACLEEHFPHSVANAIVRQAEKEGLHHEEEHAKVNYIIAHGISTTLKGERAIIGSSHFVFEDEGIERTKDIDEMITSLQDEGAHSLIYLAIGHQLAGIISIHDPLKQESFEVIQELRKVVFKKIVMMTGDSEHAAKHIAQQLSLDDYYAEVLPEDKAKYIKMLQEEGHRVVMVGDGVNDTPALSQADVSISLQNASDIARELADITLVSSELYEIVRLKKLSQKLIVSIHDHYKQIVAFNSLLIVLGVSNVLQPSQSAFLHNASTFLFSMQSTRKLLQN